MPTLRQIEYFVAVAKAERRSAVERVTTFAVRGVQLTAASKTFLPCAIAAREELGARKNRKSLRSQRADADEIS